MRTNIISFLTLSVAVGMMCACNGGGQNGDNDSINIVGLDSLPQIVEMEGIVGDGSSMNQLELIAPNGDTVYVSTPGEMVMGGVRAGDKMSVVYFVNKDENLANVAVNLSALQHVWTQKGIDGHKQSLELDANGVAVTYDMNVEYNAWELKNGCLLLHSPKNVASEKGNIVDTFHIMKLTDEELVLIHGNLETIFTLDN
ncbi:MAG: hypothetical protein IJR86_07485 [Bacteroidaceae bacterium]|jgi:hypothetical protein|nr:hypothetical protein [Bacteroidaceae bacterium]